MHIKEILTEPLRLHLEAQLIKRVESQITRERDYLLGIPFRIKKPRPSKRLIDLAEGLRDSRVLRRDKALLFVLKSRAKKFSFPLLREVSR